MHGCPPCRSSAKAVGLQQYPSSEAHCLLGHPVGAEMAACAVAAVSLTWRGAACSTADSWHRFPCKQGAAARLAWCRDSQLARLWAACPAGSAQLPATLCVCSLPPVHRRGLGGFRWSPAGVFSPPRAAGCAWPCCQHSLRHWLKSQPGLHAACLRGFLATYPEMGERQ